MLEAQVQEARQSKLDSQRVTSEWDTLSQRGSDSLQKQETDRSYLWVQLGLCKTWLLE